MSNNSESGSIESSSHETRRFDPPVGFAAKAHIKNRAEYDALYRRSIDDNDGFWGDVARSELTWKKPFTKVKSGSVPFVRWFEDGELNVSENCLDRHLEKRGNKPALIWEGEPGEQRTLTYSELHAEVCRFASALSSMGVKPGDRVAIYMPLIPEASVAMLACTRLGAAHTVVFGGFSSESLRDRINDCGAKVVVTADGGYRRGKVIGLKENVDRALAQTPSVEKCVVVERAKNPIEMTGGRDVWYHDAVRDQPTHFPAASLPAEQLLFILYTSGTTGKPKGIEHTTAGYLLGTAITSKYVFDLREDDIYWCTADIGWITGHSYMVYGLFANGATVLMYEGAPDAPAKDRFWDIIERHKVTVFYTAPTAIRTFIRWGDDLVKKHDLSSLRLLGSVGEPINPEAWMWYHRTIGQERCPIVDTWWQTETGAIMMTPIPGAIASKPGSCTVPFFGIEPQVVHKDGTPCKPNEGGFLIMKRPWPSMLRGIHGDKERYVKT
ncbi:MAG: acetate--CoA ligase, partial [Deltaproteobacteria bacterium]|nr:acetate--CoA ligase [Deltaproteobacteria bacterium]